MESRPSIMKDGFLFFVMNKQQEIENKISFRLKKEERLCSKKIIERLFAEGDSFLAYPLKVVFIKTEFDTAVPVQAGFTVSKKNFKHAVKRNRIKRLVRETYRLQKHQLYKQLNGRQIAVFFVYIGKDMPVYSKIEKAMGKSILTLIKKLAKENN